MQPFSYTFLTQSCNPLVAPGILASKSAAFARPGTLHTGGLLPYLTTALR